jgi:hypothetical protein
LGTHVFNGVSYPLPYDLVNDFEPVSLLVTNPLLIVARKPMPAKDLQELIAWLKANPGEARRRHDKAPTESACRFPFERRSRQLRTCRPHQKSLATMMQGLVGRANRPDDRLCGEFLAAGAWRHRHRAKPFASSV